MKIHTYEVEDALVLRYAKTIKELLHNYSPIVMRARIELHEEMLQSIGLRRGLDEQECDDFNTCLSEVIDGWMP